MAVWLGAGMWLWMGDDCRYDCPDVLGDADGNLFGFCSAKTFYAGQNKFCPVLGAD